MDILLALDGSPWSDAATRLALQLASGAPEPTRLTAVHVVSVVRLSGRRLRDLAGFLGFEPVLVPEKVETYYQQRGQNMLDSFARACEQAGVAHRQILDQGNVVERIVHHGDQADMVILGARGERELGWPGHGGGTAERVVKALETRVIVTPREQEPLRGIVLGYDGSAGAAKALRATRHLLRCVQVPLHAVHVTASAPARDPLDEVKAHFEGLEVELHLHRVAGEPREVLVALADQEDCNLIALGYRGRSIIGDVFLGRVTEWLLRYVHQALLVSR